VRVLQEVSVNLRRVLAFLGLGAVFGFTVFGFMVARVTHVERLGPDIALARFEAARDSLGTLRRPLTVVDGQARRSAEIDSVIAEVDPPETLRVMAYRGSQEGLVEVSIPLWFLRLKAPVVDYLLRDTGWSLRELGLSPDDLQRSGRAVVIDEQRANGDRILVWTQ
jgi:hypothetical protein